MQCFVSSLHYYCRIDNNDATTIVIDASESAAIAGIADAAVFVVVATAPVVAATRWRL